MSRDDRTQQLPMRPDAVQRRAPLSEERRVPPNRGPDQLGHVLCRRAHRSILAQDHNTARGRGEVDE